MENIIPFPTPRGHAWSQIEEAFRDYLMASGIGKRATDWILADLEPRFLRMRANVPDIVVSMPVEMVEIKEKIQAATTSNIMWAVIEMLKLEIELYRVNSVP